MSARLTISALIVICFVACKKSTPSAAPTPPPNNPQIVAASINGISPTSGPDSTIVTITGASQLTAIVPLRAGTGNVSVKVDTQSANGPVFSYIYTTVVTTLAGNGVAGYAGGAATTAEFQYPDGVAVDANGNVFVMDGKNNRIRKIDPSGMVTTLAGSGLPGFVDGKGINAQLNWPGQAIVDAKGDLYFTDRYACAIRKADSSGLITTIAGNGMPGFADGNDTSAEFVYPLGIAMDARGNIYVGDEGNQRIRKITPSGLDSTLAGRSFNGGLPGGGGGMGGYADGPGVTALFFSPAGVALDALGNLYVAEAGNSLIRKITPEDTVNTVAGSSQGFTDGQGSAAQFYTPYGIAMDTLGNIYAADAGNNSIRKITLSGDVTTVAGTRTTGYADGNAAAALFNLPMGVAVDKQGNIYVADTNNNRIRKISFQ